MAVGIGRKSSIVKRGIEVPPVPMKSLAKIGHQLAGIQPLHGQKFINSLRPPQPTTVLFCQCGGSFA